MKKLLSLLLGSMLMLSLSACSGNGGGGEIADINKSADAAIKAGGFTDTLVKLEESTLPASYTTLDLTGVKEFSVHVSGTMGTPEEVAIIRANSKDDIAGIKAAVQRRLEDLKLNFEDYRPDEMPKIDSAVVLERGDCIVLIVAPDSEAASKAI